MNFFRFAGYSVAAFFVPLMLTSSTFELGSPTPAQEFTPSTETKSIKGVKLAQIESKFVNHWTPEFEKEFQQRSETVIRHFAKSQGYGSGYGENEKSSYPKAMFDFLAGNRQGAIAFLQAEDPQADKHQHTKGIDFYYCFTLKGQVRKYFLFGQFLDPAYKKRMFLGAKKWTEQDPKKRPHPIYGYGNGKGNAWDISARGAWVDNRNTDNLRAMRDISVYLMAEETGNEATRQLYKQKIQRYVWSLYNIGMGEWDSEAYFSHTFAPYLNLYDFAKDPEVKALAKNALDWMSTAAAVKYYRGGWGGPTKRDYGGGNVPLSASAAKAFWLYFGDAPNPNFDPELDSLHIITSTYRPPQAVVALARKQFNKPVEIFASKPLYENWKPGYALSPGYWETQFFANTYQMGSLAGEFPDGDVAPFKLMAYNSRRGVDFFVANTGGNWVHPGKNSGDRIGQYRNLLIWLRPADNTPFFFQLPKTAKAEIEEGIWFFRLEKTWLAIRPINLDSYVSYPITDRKYSPIYRQENTYRATTTGNSYAGFVLEVGEQQSHGTYQAFKQAVKQKSQLDLSQLDKGQVKLQGADGKTIEIAIVERSLLPTLIRDGKQHNWSKNFALYNSQSSDKAPIFLDWRQGKLTVKAGNLHWRSVFD
jgi:hypothetical protein